MGIWAPVPSPACLYLIKAAPTDPAADSGPSGPGPGAEQQLHRVRRREGHGRLQLPVVTVMPLLTI